MPLALFGLVAALSAAPQRPVGPDDVYALAGMSSLEVSPDGKMLAYVIERADRTEDSFRHELWLTDAQGQNARRVCPKQTDCTEPKFSPDGKRLAYLSDADETQQLWVARVGGGGKRAITSGDVGVSEFDWAPDGTKLVIVKNDPRVRKTDKTPWVITGSQIQRDGQGFDDGRHTHLWIVEASGGTPKPLTSGAYDDATPRWSPKGDLIAFVSNRNFDPEASDDTDIWLVSAKGGMPRKLAANPGPDTDPVWSHAGDRIAFVGTLRANDYYQTTHVMVAPVEGGAACDLTAALDNWVSLDDVVGGGSEQARIAWSADDATLTVPFDRRGANWIGAVPSLGGEPKELLGGARVYGFVRVSNATKRIYYTLSTPTTLYELWTAGRDGTGAHRIAGPNDAALGGLKLVQPEKIQAKNGAGDTIDAWLYPPLERDPGKTYPMILYIHGGPQEYDGEFFETGLENQLFPGKGWAVLRVNYRGSTVVRPGVLARGLGGLAHPRARGPDGRGGRRHRGAPVDRSRTGWAWAAGRTAGIMTIWIVGHTERFKVGVPERFEIDYASCFGTDQWHAQYVTELGKPWESPSVTAASRPAPRSRTSRRRSS
jgi:dipeptidyl aminopeptidase/acylaminoacyl peptidase